MPLHSYSTDRRPPTVWDHFLAHPFELVFAAWGILGGLASIYAALTPRATVSPSLDDLPEPVAGAVGALLVLGGIAIWRGLLDDSDDLMIGWRIERSGLILSGVAWAAYGLTVAWAAPGSALSWSLSGLIVLMFGLRYWATIKEERRQRRAIRR